MIYKPTSTDTNEIIGLIKSAVKHMDDNGIFQWDDEYPDEKVISEDVENGNLYCYDDDGKLAGIIVLNEEDSEEYSDADWSIDADRILYVHRLCIHPDFQGRGISKILMKHAEEFAAENNYDAIRLDAFSENPAALSLYKRLNYLNAGEIKMRKGNFICFEKKISS